jgi:hypothetical protein
MFFISTAIFARTAKICHRHFIYLKKAKYSRNPTSAPTWKATGHIQMLVQARRCHVFDLAEDGGRTDFNKILGDH